jgi:hypothetical protein
MTADAIYSFDEVADRLAIHDVMARYVHALDAREYDRLDDVFTPDARCDFSSAGGITGTWAADIKPWYEKNLHVFVDYFHLIGNIRIELAPDRSTARTKSKVINPTGMRGEDGAIHHFETVGVWDDGWTKTADGWRISERTWIHGWVWGDYPSSQPPGDF